MSTFTLYVDDSGTHRQSPFAIAACFLSDDWRWEAFNEQWELARRKPAEGFDVFHMADFVARQGELKNWTDDKADRVIDRLMSIIENCTLAAFVSAVVKDDYDRIVTGRLREKLGTYHYTFAESCLAHIAEWKATNAYGSGSVHYVFDRMSEGKREIISVMEDLVKHNLAPHFGLEPGGFSFENKAQILPLQSADILAWNGYRYVRDCQLPASRGQAEGQPHRSFLRLVNQTPRMVDLYTRDYDGTTLREVSENVSAEYEKIGWDNSPRGGLF